MGGPETIQRTPDIASALVGLVINEKKTNENSIRWAIRGNCSAFWAPMVARSFSNHWDFSLDRGTKKDRDPGNSGTRSSVTSRIQGEGPHIISVGPILLGFSSLSVVLPEKEPVLEQAEGSGHAPSYTPSRS